MCILAALIRTNLDAVSETERSGLLLCTNKT